MRLTKEQAILEHRKMWNWIADESEKRKLIIKKRDYFEFIEALSPPLFDCYCCEYNSLQNDANGIINCEKCPIDWGSTRNSFMCEDLHIDGNRGGLYAQWRTCSDVETAVRLAREIANLPKNINI